MKENRIFLIGILFITILIVSLAHFFNKNKFLNTQARHQQLKIAQQAELIDSIKRSDLVHMMSNVLDRTDDELQVHPKRILSDERIASITALSYFFKPYTFQVGDSISDKPLSPERGHLLLMLSAMNIDSGSFHKIMLKASFAGAVLRDANLKDAKLQGVDLRGADLQDANFQGANLYDAEMKSANLWGANMSGANLGKVDLTTADMKWSVLNRVNFQMADLHGADIASAQLRKSNLIGANLQWAEMSGTILHEANLTGANMASTNMKRAQLENAILNEANLTSSHLNEANLTGANLTGATLTLANMTGANLSGTELQDVVVTDKNWLNMLDDWGVIGAKEIQGRYNMVDVSFQNQPKYQLEKIQK